MTTIPHSKPTLPSDAEWADVLAQLQPGWAADGPVTRRFAAELAQWFGGAEGAVVNSGTNALHLALVAVGVKPDSEVLIPAYACAALLNAVQQAGARPVLVDSEPGGFNLCPENARRRMTSRSSAVVVAHTFGQPAPLQPFLDLGIPVVEDCAQSLGAKERGALSGARSHAVIGSFFATKVITTGHGGFVGSTRPEVAERIRDLLDYDNRDHWEPRFNYGVSEMQAALGLWQLQRLPGFLARRYAIARYYDEVAVGLGLKLGRSRATADNEAIFFRYVLRVPDAESAMRSLNATGVGAKRPVYRPLHHYLGGDCPHAESAHQEIVSLPIFPQLPDAELERVAESLAELAKASGAGWRR